MHVPQVEKSVAVMQAFDTVEGAFMEVMTRKCKGWERPLDTCKGKPRYDGRCKSGPKCAKGNQIMVLWIRTDPGAASGTTKMLYISKYVLGTKYTLSASVSNYKFHFT